MGGVPQFGCTSHRRNRARCPLFSKPMVEHLPVHRGQSRDDDGRPNDRPPHSPGGSADAGEPGGCSALARDGAWRPHRSFRGRARGPGGHTMISPLTSVALFHLGPVPVTAGVVVTWAIMAVLVLGGILVTRRLSLVPSSTQAAFELVVDTVDIQIRTTMRVEPAPYRAFVGTLFAFIFVANWSSLVPGIEPPTAHLETDAALALLVFVAVIWIVLSLAGLLVPIPLMALDLLTGAVQAYIFAVLAMVFIAGAIGEEGQPAPDTSSQ